MITQQVLDGKHSDFTVTVNGNLILRLHKVFLESCPVFSDMFDSVENCSTSNFDNIDRPDVLKDLLYTFYLQPLPCDQDQIYKLYLLEYMTMLLLDINEDEFLNLTIPATKYRILVDIIVPLLLVHPRFMSLLRDNLPINFDLSFLPQSLIDEIKGTNYKLIKEHLRLGYNIKVIDTLTDKCVYDDRTSDRRKVEISNRGLMFIQDESYTHLVDVRSKITDSIYGHNCSFLSNGTILTIEFHWNRDIKFNFSVIGYKLKPVNFEVYNIWAKFLDIKNGYITWITNDKLVLYDSSINEVSELATNINHETIFFTVCGLYIVGIKDSFATVYNLNGEIMYSGYTQFRSKLQFNPITSTLTGI